MQCLLFVIFTAKVHVGYKRPKKTGVLTPKCKHLGKAVAHRSQKTIAVECIKDPITRKHVVRLIGKEFCKEIQFMASENAQSVLCSQSAEDLKEFKWDTLHAKLSNKAPILQSILLAATNTRVPRPNAHIVVGTCAAILLKHRNPKMSLLQKIISFVLYAGHASKQVCSLLLIHCYTTL